MQIWPVKVDESEAKGTGIMTDLLLGMAKPDTSGKSALYYIIYENRA